MCGIVGKVDIDKCIAEKITKPLKALYHRGPDKQDKYCNEDILLGHTRLSIIDTEHGDQPMKFLLDGREFIIVYNGEIYNFKNLREILIKDGLEFETDCDTEVVLKWLAYKGVKNGINELNGMFAIALYDVSQRKVYLMRDRMGIKPLYYSHNDALYFSSELESIVKFEGIERKLNKEAMEQFLYFGYPVAPNTMYEDVFELRPGHILSYYLDTKAIEHTQYWSVYDYERDYKGSYEDAIEELDSLLNQTIKDQIVSDVGYGTFLSGGIDSSLVTAIVSKINKDKFNSYTVSFDDKEYDELPYAKKVVDKYSNINHIVYYSSNFNLDSNFVDLILKHVGQPFADSSCIPTYLISNEVSKNEKVILSGDGGDELFMGYETFSWMDKIDKIKAVPLFLKEFILYIFKKLPIDVLVNPNFNRQVNKALRYSMIDKASLSFSLNSIFDIVDLEKITNKTSFLWLEELKKEINLKDIDSHTVMQRFLIKIKLSGDMLKKVDSMTMANSIEVRVPLLDNRIIDFALSLPIEFLYKDGVKKRILRDVAKRYLPEDVITHKKWGFSIPMHKVLEKEFIEKYKYLYDRYSVLNDDLVNEFYSFKEDNNTKIYKDYSQYTIDHVNWMTILLYRWIEKNGVKYE